MKGSRVLISPFNAFMMKNEYHLMVHHRVCVRDHTRAFMQHASMWKECNETFEQPLSCKLVYYENHTAFCIPQNIFLNTKDHPRSPAHQNWGMLSYTSSHNPCLSRKFRLEELQREGACWVETSKLQLWLWLWHILDSVEISTEHVPIVTLPV